MALLASSMLVAGCGGQLQQGGAGGAVGGRTASAGGGGSGQGGAGGAGASTGGSREPGGAAGGPASGAAGSSSAGEDGGPGGSAGNAAGQGGAVGGQGGSTPLGDGGVSQVVPSTAIVAAGGGGRRVFSPDGRSWTDAPDILDGNGPAADADNQYNLTSVCCGGGLCMVGSHQGWVWTSSNGRDWTQVATVRNYSIDACAYGHGIFTSGSKWTENGADWHDTTFDSRVHAIASFNGTFVMASDAGMFSSEDGRSWTPIPGPTDARRLAMASDRIAALSADGRSVAVSRDGHQWSTTTLRVNSIPDWTGEGLAYGAGRFFVLGERVSFQLLDQQEQWTQLVAMAPGVPSALIGNADVLVVTVSGGFFWSRDGRSWTAADVVGDPARRFAISQITNMR